MPRQVDRDARLDAICSAVAAVAEREGFRAVTIRRVAAEAGASTSVVTHYVASREDLLRLAVRRLLATRREHLARMLDGVADEPGQALRAFVEGCVVHAQPGHRLWLALVVGAQEERVLRLELDRFNDWWESVLAPLALAATGDEAAAAALVDAVDVVVDGLVLVGFDEGRPWPTDRRRQVLDRVLGPAPAQA